MRCSRRLSEQLNIRVVHVCAYFAPAFVYGGPPRSILGLCAAQQHAGLDVRVVTTTANGDDELPEDANAMYDGVPVQYCARAWPRSVFRAPSLGVAVRTLLASTDVVHLHGLWNAAIWAAAAEARRARRPYVLSPRGMLSPAALAHDAWRKRAAYLAFDRAVIRDAAAIHATSRRELDELASRFGASRTCYASNGVVLSTSDTTDSCETRRQFGLGSGPLVLFLGRVHPIKRLDLLATAFARVRQQHPESRLVIAGPDEDGYRSKLAPLFVPFGDAVTWTGAVAEPEKRKLLDACSMLVLCSDSESFGMSAAEAMGASKPVVVTKGCPWPEVDSHETGFWVEQSAGAIADGISTILSDPRRAIEMGQRGRALIEERYTWPKAVAQLEEVYRRLVPGTSHA
jgi:glycosyltransferase involved in cell wall biosynthesis